MTATAARPFSLGKWLYPAMAVGLLALILGIQYCPVASREAPDFTLPVVTTAGQTGDRMRLHDLRGKVVLLDFWATWCGPCRMSTPGLVRIGQRYRARGLVVIGINVDENSPDAVPGFMRHFGMDYPVLFDEGTAQRDYRIQALPTAILIDREGRIRREHQGMSSEDDLAELIERLL